MKQTGARIKIDGYGERALRGLLRAITADGIDAPPLNYWVERPVLRRQMSCFRRINGQLRVGLRQLAKTRYAATRSRFGNTAEICDERARAFLECVWPGMAPRKLNAIPGLIARVMRWGEKAK